MNQIHTELFLDYIEKRQNISGVIEDFKLQLEKFQRHLVASENLLLQVPENCGEWYLGDLINEAKDRRPIETNISYIEDQESKRIIAFGIWKVQSLTQGILNSDFKDVLVTELIELFVREETRGQGLGKQIFEYIERKWKKQWSSFIGLDVLADNSLAMKLYQEMNMKPWMVSMIKPL